MATRWAVVWNWRWPATCRIAAETAKLGQPEINLGLIPGFGGTQRLLRLTGRAAALELCLLGEPIDAARAYQLGLGEPGRAGGRARRSHCPDRRTPGHQRPLALRAVLDAVIVGGECGLDEGLEFESAQFGLMFASEDMREGTGAFLQRRKPSFSGR